MNKKLKQIIKKIPGYRIVKQKIKKEGCYSTYEIEQIQSLTPVRSKSSSIRLNLLIPSVCNNSVYAGAKTALDFFFCLSKHCNAKQRILQFSASSSSVKHLSLPDIFEISDGISEKEHVVVDLMNRSKPIAIGENDVFIATAWGTAYAAMTISKWFEKEFGKPIKIIYLIQDFEPGFHPWSSKYILADSTYRMTGKIIAVFNSFSLKEYFEKAGYDFFSQYAFMPRLNPQLRDYLFSHKDNSNRKKQILIYGRPFAKRNAFELVIMALNEWYAKDPNAKDWTILSAGYEMPDIKCPSGAKIHVVGKMSLEDYAKTMLETSVGISLMVSPHPSYPPLEMAAFGVHVITNQFANKDLSSFSSNITSLERCTVSDIVSALIKLTSKDIEHRSMTEKSEYLEDSEIQWETICEGIKKDFNL